LCSSLGLPCTQTSGDVEFISEDNYGKPKAEYEAYRESLGQAKEVHDYSPAHLQTEETHSLVEAEDDADGHWVMVNRSIQG
jgi:hypothetical protein